MAFPTKPPHLRTRGRGRDAPEYGPLHCAWCYRLVKLANFTQWRFHCECGWKFPRE
jgi:hypothetical protein